MRTNAILARYPELHQLAAVMLEQMNKGCIRKAWSLSRYISDHTDYETLPLLTQAEVQRVIATGEYIFNLNDLGMSAFKTATSLAQSVSDDDTQSEPARVEARETLSRIRFFSELCEEKSRAWKDRRVREKAPREAVSSSMQA